jgi:hypothetical protein
LKGTEMNIGQKFIYTKGIDTSTPTTKKMKVKDTHGETYTIDVPTKTNFCEHKCKIVDVITTHSVSKSKTEVSYDVEFEFSKTDSRIYNISEKSSMWKDMKEITK